MTPFQLDDLQARECLEELKAQECLPTMWLDSPAGAIDAMFGEIHDLIDKPDGYDVLIYPLVYDADPDGVIVMVSRPHPAPSLAISMEWDDLVPGPRDDFLLAHTLTVGQVLAVVQEIVRYANDLLSRQGALT